jgi:hypothetical protein
MKVYVVMSNDYPDSVFKTEAGAEEFVSEKIDYERDRRSLNPMSGRIHWRYYEFELHE